MALRNGSHDPGSHRLLPLREKVPEGRMRGLLPSSHTPHPALRATFSHKGRRKDALVPHMEEPAHGRL